MDSKAAENFTSFVNFLSLFQKLPATLVLHIIFSNTEIVQISNAILL